MTGKTLVEGGHADTVLAPSESHPRNVDPSSDAFTEAGTRYRDRRVLGTGGMGEVRLCGDQWIGRDVAMKVVRSGTGSTSETRGRFLREARVQGQLEHPSIVPVYDLGRMASGESFFTMKRIGGHTLERLFLGLRENDPEITTAYSRRKLLAAMSQVCLTVAYAHSRGVVHRDLKPANVMLGDFGEVYVLDWGVAKIAGAADVVTGDVISGDATDLQTNQGSLVGTPGFMAPEQARGDVDVVGPASDIYALGAMLFELLALEPLHHGTTLVALVASSQKVADAPSARAPNANVPPELDAICVRATALEPADRFPSARAMHEAIERYLDGERDAERRKELAKGYASKALESLALASAGGADAKKHRADGLHALGQAVTLDPTDEGALRTISELVLAPFDELPSEAREELRMVELRDRALAARRMSRTYIAWLVMLSFIGLMGIRSMPALVALAVVAVLIAAYAAWMGSAPERAAPKYMRVGLILNCTLVGMSSFAFGPFLLTPGLAASSAAGYVIATRANAQTRRFAFVLAGCAVGIPAAAQLLGIMPASYTFEAGLIQIHPFLAEFPPTATLVALALLTLAQIVIPALNINSGVHSLVRAEQDNFAQAWRLRQLLPSPMKK